MQTSLNLGPAPELTDAEKAAPTLIDNTADLLRRPQPALGQREWPRLGSVHFDKLARVERNVARNGGYFRVALWRDGEWCCFYDTAPRQTIPIGQCARGYLASLDNKHFYPMEHTPHTAAGPFRLGDSAP